MTGSSKVLTPALAAKHYGDEEAAMQQEPEPEESPIDRDSLAQPRSPTNVKISTKVEEVAELLGGQPESQTPTRGQVLKRGLSCVGLSTGVIVALSCHGIFQERIMSLPYDGEYFRASAFLVLCNRMVGVAFAATMARLRGESLTSAVPAWKYCIVSLGNVVAAMCQYEALKWVSYPMQLLGKSFKMIPVMLWGMAMSRKKHKLSEWVVSAAITTGVVEFMLSGDVSAPNAPQGDSIYGIFLLILFVAADSFTSTFQEQLFREHKTTKYNQMLYVNLCSIAIALLGLLAHSDYLWVFRFCARHPKVLSDAAAISVASVTGQYFIVSVVKDFGALTLAATMNVRQLLSIVLSYHVYGHRMSPMQAVGLVLVFATMFLKSARSMWLKLKRSSGEYQKVEVAKDVASPEAQCLGKEHNVDVGDAYAEVRRPGHGNIEAPEKPSKDCSEIVPIVNGKLDDC